MPHSCGQSVFVEAYLTKFEVIKSLNSDERKELKEDCPICLQGYNSSTITTSVSCSCGHYPVKIIDCGHIIHVGCYVSLILDKKYACPHCTVVPKFLNKTK